MHLVALTWGFIAVLMAAAEAVSPQGSLLGAAITLLLYGVVPLSIVLYVLATPMRRRARLRRLASSDDCDRSSHAPGDAIAPEREEPRR